MINGETNKKALQASMPSKIHCFSTYRRSDEESTKEMRDLRFLETVGGLDFCGRYCGCAVFLDIYDPPDSGPYSGRRDTPASPAGYHLEDSSRMRWINQELIQRDVVPCAYINWTQWLRCHLDIDRFLFWYDSMYVFAGFRGIYWDGLPKDGVTYLNICNRLTTLPLYKQPKVMFVHDSLGPRSYAKSFGSWSFFSTHLLFGENSPHVDIFDETFMTSLAGPLSLLPSELLKKGSPYLYYKPYTEGMSSDEAREYRSRVFHKWTEYGHPLRVNTGQHMDEFLDCFPTVPDPRLPPRSDHSESTEPYTPYPASPQEEG